MSTDTPKVQPQEEVEQVEVPNPEKEPSFADFDPRKDIYAKSDAQRFPVPSPEPEIEETPEEETAEEKPAEEKPPEEKKTEEPEVVEEEEPTPREKRKAENLERKEARLNAWEAILRDQFEGAEKPPRVKIPDPATTPLRQMSEEQFDVKYDELFTESPSKARRFERQYEAAKEAARRESEEQRIDSDFRDFREAYPDVTADDWVRMNDEQFYRQYPDIIKAMEKGNHFAAFVAANAHLQDEKRTAAKQTEKAREAALKARDDLKKKGQVLRMQTKQEPTIQKKDEGPVDPLDERRAHIRQRIEEARARMGLQGSPRK